MGTLAKLPEASERIEQVLIDGDLSGLKPEERLALYQRVCASLGLNPLTKPFAYIRLNNKLTLYALKDCTDQLRTIHDISITLPAREVIDGIYVVTSHAQRVDGRQDESTGAVPIEGLKGESKANAMMKAETKAKRRVTLSICGLGMLDESEISSIPGAAPEPADTQRNTIAEQADLAKRRIQETRGEAPTQGAGDSPADPHVQPPTHPASEVPPPLKALFDSLGKPGYVKQAYSLLKNRLIEISPEGGAAEYESIIDHHKARGSMSLDLHKAVLLEMWNTADEWNAQLATATDADVPAGQGSLL